MAASASVVKIIKQESQASAKVSTRQPWYIGCNSLNRPSLRNAQQYQGNLYIIEKYFQCATILSPTMRVYLHLFSRCCLPKMQSWTYSRSRSSKVIDLGVNRKCICDFLLARHSRPNLGPILHRFWDTATYWMKTVYFSYPSLIWCPAPYVPFRISWSVNHEETRVMGLLCGESCMILTSNIFDWSTRVTDRRTGNST